MPKLRDLKGQRFGRLVVLNRTKRPEGLSKRAAYWLCRCDCGKEVVIISSALIDYGDNGIQRSCGCLQKDVAREIIKRRTDGNPARNRVWSYYRSAAKKKGIRFELTKEQFFDLTDGSCFYCGSEPKMVAFNQTKKIKYTHNGVDRLDNSVGYVVDNCVSCCTYCNKAKLVMTVEEFRSWVKNIYHNFVEGVENE